MGKTIDTLWIRFQVWLTVRKIRSLSSAELLSFMLNPETGLGIEDCDRLVRLTFGNYLEGESRETIIHHVSEKFVQAHSEKTAKIGR